MTEPIEPIDLLTDPGSVSGVFLVNFGDPAFRNLNKPGPLPRAESIFLRLIAYLLFAEVVAVPTRYILDGDEMAKAIYWATPLLEECILVPERRSGPESFDQLVRMRKLPELALRRAEHLDRHANLVRTFHYGELSSTYVKLLSSDLSSSGAFRRVIPGATRGRQAQSLSRSLNDALRHFVRTTDGTPEAFALSVQRANPKLYAQAKRWAMARYYTTPLLYDRANTREIPDSAARLLTRGRVLDFSRRPFDSAAPVDEAYTRLEKLHIDLPEGSIEKYYRQYCEALLEVRRTTAPARKLFEDIRTADEISAAGLELSERFAAELARQKAERPSKGRVFTVGSSLAGGLIAFEEAKAVVDQTFPQLTAGLAAAVGTGVLSNEAMRMHNTRRIKRRQPWLLAIDQLQAEWNHVGPKDGA